MLPFYLKFSEREKEIKEERRYNERKREREWINGLISQLYVDFLSQV